METQQPTICCKLPNELCQQIFNCEFQIDIGNVTEELIAKTIQLYEAMTVFANSISENCEKSDFDLKMTTKKHNFYQQKIKKLLSRNEVEKCLVGQQTNRKTLDFERELQKVHESAPQQTKRLIEHFKNHHQNQQKLINSSISDQTNKLQERIRRRSMSRGKRPQNKGTTAQFSGPKVKDNIVGKKLLI